MLESALTFPKHYHLDKLWFQLVYSEISQNLPDYVPKRHKLDTLTFVWIGARKNADTLWFSSSAAISHRHASNIWRRCQEVTLWRGCDEHKPPVHSNTSKNNPLKQSTRPTSTSSCPLVIRSPNLISTGLLLDSLKPLGLICPGPSLGGDDLSGLLGGDGSFSLVSATTRTLFFLVSWRVEALDPVFQENGIMFVKYPV